VLSQELSVCVARLLQSYLIELYQKLWMRVSYIFIASEINIFYRNVFVLYSKVYKLYIRYIYIIKGSIHPLVV